ncbi:RNA-binding S4 domain-containing protein [Thioalkalivibrio sp. ALJ16]|uniref:RNA-binding S4 domain-containing protein n=1 Tax=Thioalkalivibrio sp. ALJ16 TaxID=1158762 RepID=UPI00036FF938|nr:RNA-binding S4 domain-containing protein [Thioalkalivibrio sp. ALJ16]
MGRGNGQAAPGSAGLRIDKWLWAARFFKTRALATEAVSGGKVHVNGERCKPARRLHPGDRLTIHRGTQVWELDVVALNDQRRPASEAQALYTEIPESEARRAAEGERRRAERAGADRAPGRRPDKRDRRKIRRFIRQDASDRSEPE